MLTLSLLDCAPGPHNEIRRDNNMIQVLKKSDQRMAIGVNQGWLGDDSGSDRRYQRYQLEFVADGKQ